MLKLMIKRTLAAAIAAALLTGAFITDTAQAASARNNSASVSNRPSAPSAEQLNRRKILARQEAAAKAKREAEAREAKQKTQAEAAKLKNEKEKVGTTPKDVPALNNSPVEAPAKNDAPTKKDPEAAAKPKREAETRVTETEAAKAKSESNARQTEKLIEPDDEAALIERYSRTGMASGTNAAGRTEGIRPLGGSEVSRGGSILRSRAIAEKEQRNRKKESAAVAATNNTVSVKGWKVKEAQRKLAILGYEPGKVTGELNAATERALKKFQDDNGLKETGKLDNKTYEKISWKAFSRTGIRSVKGGDIVKQASRYKGTPYVFGGTTPKGFDCSGYVQYVFKQKGAKLGRTADVQALEGIFVTQRRLKPGDLVFFTTYEAGASHVGIYAGSGKFWNATSSRGVMLCDMKDSYWKSRYYGARRVLVENGEN